MPHFNKVTLPKLMQTLPSRLRKTLKRLFKNDKAREKFYSTAFTDFYTVPCVVFSEKKDILTQVPIRLLPENIQKNIALFSLFRVPGNYPLIFTSTSENDEGFFLTFV
jgi:hypothetical protein